MRTRQNQKKKKSNKQTIANANQRLCENVSRIALGRVSILNVFSLEQPTTNTKRTNNRKQKQT